MSDSYEAFIKVFRRVGEAFEEEPAIIREPDSKGDLDIELPLEDAQEIRVELGALPAYVRVGGISTDQGVLTTESMVGAYQAAAGNICVFYEENPFFTVSDWFPGSRVFYCRMNVLPLTPETAPLIAKELGWRDETIRHLRKVDQHRQELLIERSNLLDAIADLKVIRSYRKMRQLMKKEDPFLKIHPRLKNDPEGICYYVDEITYHREVCMVRGWAFDREYVISDIRIVNVKKQPVECKIMRQIRADVAEQFGLDPKERYGFSISINYEDIQDDPLFIEIHNLRGFVRRKLNYEADAERQRQAEETRQGTGIDYNDWAIDHKPTREELDLQRRYQFRISPKLSVVVPLYKTPERYLTELVDSIKAQTYTNWELILSDGSGSPSPIEGYLKTVEESDARIKVVHNRQQFHISENTNAALDEVSGDFVVFCDHDDILTPDAFYENVRMINKYPETEMIYSDEDKITDDWMLAEPHFKPDFNLDLLLTNNYICHLLVVKRSLQEEVGGLNPAFDGAQDYDFVLRCVSKTKNIRHIPKALYHWRISATSTAENPESKEYAFYAGKRAVEAYYEREGIPAEVSRTKASGWYKTTYRWDEEPLVSIIIPNKDHGTDLEKCIKSIEEKSTYRNYEYIIVENNSENPETFLLYENLKRSLPNLRVVVYKDAFNYSAINNYGVKFAEGQYLLFLNNDTEVISPDFMKELLGYCLRPDVGACGARLYYADGSIQHAGVIVGLGGLAGHAFAKTGHDDPGYMNRIGSAQDVSAVTAACMMMRKDVFDGIGGFYEGMAVAFNDVDLCMKITQAGYKVVYNPAVELYHYESKSRGNEDTKAKVARFEQEVGLFRERWPEILANGDPYYNPNFTLRRNGYELRERDEPVLG
ncbi:MAG: glycosyltransferase family 2 protein [Lachnospiraceae bacterium]|nr:glycosyltransferase family 2 protein [Lachnospiraceae bacterium]